MKYESSVSMLDEANNDFANVLESLFQFYKMVQIMEIEIQIQLPYLTVKRIPSSIKSYIVHMNIEHMYILDWN